MRGLLLDVCARAQCLLRDPRWCLGELLDELYEFVSAGERIVECELPPLFYASVEDRSSIESAGKVWEASPCRCGRRLNVNSPMPNGDSDLRFESKQPTMLLRECDRLRNAERTAAGKKRRLSVRRVPYGPCNALGGRLGFECALSTNESRSRGGRVSFAGTRG